MMEENTLVLHLREKTHRKWDLTKQLRNQTDDQLLSDMLNLLITIQKYSHEGKYTLILNKRENTFDLPHTVKDESI